MNPEWLSDAECRGANNVTFFPEAGDGYTKARAFCARCQVRAECLADALKAEAHAPGQRSVRAGMYGGLTPDERRKAARAAA